VMVLALTACGGASAPPASVNGQVTSSSAASKPAASTAPAAAGAPVSAAAKPAGLTEIRFGLQANGAAAPVLVGTDDGSDAAAGVTLTITNFNDTSQALVAVLGGQLDMAIVATGPAAFNAFNRGADVKLIVSSGQEAPGHAAFLPLIARADLVDSGAVKTPAQLKGRKVALVAKGNIAEYDLARALSTVGLKPQDLDLTTMPFPDMVIALGNKAIDAAMIVHPIADQAIAKGVGKIISDDYAPGTQNAVIVASTKFLDQHADAATNFIAGFVQLVRKLDDGGLKKDDHALAILEKYTKTPPAVIRQGPDSFWPKDGRISSKSLQDEEAYFLEAKELEYSKPLAWPPLIDEHFLDAALKKIGG